MMNMNDLLLTVSGIRHPMEQYNTAQAGLSHLLREDPALETREVEQHQSAINQSGTTAEVPPPLSPAASEAAAGDIEIPEGVDPNFQAALPFTRLSLHSITDGRVSLERIVTDRLVHYFWVGHEQTNCFIF